MERPRHEFYELYEFYEFYVFLITAPKVLTSKRYLVRSQDTLGVVFGDHSL